MLAIIEILVTLTLIVFLLNRNVKMGNAMLAGSLMLFVLSGQQFYQLSGAIVATVSSLSSWEILLALYFVMCLEYQLRTGGIIDGLMSTARHIFQSDRVLLAMMPAFLGFLPSLGGAIFSAPLVESASKRFDMTGETKTAVNYWFRHIWEYTNPILTSMLLASQLSGIPLSSLVSKMIWVTFLSLGIGWLVLITPLKYRSGEATFSAAAVSNGTADTIANKRYVILAVGPIVANFVLVIFLKLSASVSMALVVASMVVILRQNRVDIQAMLIHALDKKLFWGIVGILFFQNVLRQSGTIGDIAVLLNEQAVSTAMIIGIIAFFSGLLTGVSQGFVAITFPFIAELAPGNLGLAMICFVMGMAGQMLSPAHLCLLVTLDYFKADFLKTLRPILLMEFVVASVAYGVIYLMG